jgi:predicted ester cyclase
MNEPEGAFPYKTYVDEVWNAHNASALAKYFTPDVRVHSLTPGIGPGVGLAYLQALAQSLFDAFPDVHFRVEGVVQQGSNLAARLTLEGTQRKDFAGIPGTGRRMKVYDFAMYRIRNGKFSDVYVVAG